MSTPDPRSNAPESAPSDARGSDFAPTATGPTASTTVGGGPGLPEDAKGRSGVLDAIEWVGNKLPDPATLFLLGTMLVMVLSHMAFTLDWKVVGEQPAFEKVALPDGSLETNAVIDPDTGEQVWIETGQTYQSNSLMTREGLYWLINNLVDNFMAFPPLGVVLVGMLGIGVAERTGLLAAILKAVMLVVPGSLLTPAMVFTGIMSSMTLDAGYVVLPPLAAALYKSVGRSPLAGIAAVFAGVSAGFNANLLVTGLDPMLAGFSTPAAQIIDSNYRVAATCNWGFMAVSTVVITLTGWMVTAIFVERRLEKKSPEEGGPLHPTADELDAQRLKPAEISALMKSVGALAIAFGLVLAAILIPGAPLHTYTMPVAGSPGETVEAELWQPMHEGRAVTADWTLNEMQDAAVFTDVETGGSVAVPVPAGAYVTESGKVLVPSSEHFQRWVNAIVPILFFCFLIPAIVYGFAYGNLKNDKDIARLMIDSMAAMAPIVVLAFFAAQFTESFKYSGLDRMLAMEGGQVLGKSGLPPYVLMIAFILVVLVFNLFVGSMSAKYAMFAPIFIPMFMMVGISPELTQAAYRIGDSVSNIITPLNAYLVIILVFMQKYVPKAGMGTLISTMLPYTIVFTIVWSILLVLWMMLGIPLGPDGPLWYDPASMSVPAG